MTSMEAHIWGLAPIERRRAVHELGNLRAALDWALASVDDRALAYELLGKCWFVWMDRGLTSECAQRMLQLWPLPSNLPARVEANFCLGFARLNKNAAREEHWEAARRAEVLYRQLGDADALVHALLLIAVIGALRDRMAEVERALREAEELITESAALSKQAALAGTQGECYLRRGAPDLAITAFRQQAELFRRAGDVAGCNVALGNSGLCSARRRRLGCRDRITAQSGRWHAQRSAARLTGSNFVSAHSQSH